jgi:hypothetical protein
MEPKFLYPSRLHLLFVPLFGLVGIAMSIWVISHSYAPFPHDIFPPLLYFGSGSLLLFCAILWVVGGIINFFHRACFLKLDDEGLTAFWLFLSLSLKWENVRVFRTYQLPSKPFGISFKNVVADVFNVTEIKYNHRLYMGLIGYLNGPEAYASLMRRKFGSDAILISNYGLSAEGLADLLNEWRMRHSQTTQLI